MGHPLQKKKQGKPITDYFKEKLNKSEETSLTKRQVSVRISCCFAGLIIPIISKITL